MTASAYLNQSFELQSSVAGEKKGRKRKLALKTIDMLSEKFVSFWFTTHRFWCSILLADIYCLGGAVYRDSPTVHIFHT